MTADERSYCHVQIFEILSRLRQDDIEQERLKEFATAYAKGNPYAEKAYILEQENKQLLTELKKIKESLKNTAPPPTKAIEPSALDIKAKKCSVTDEKEDTIPKLKDCSIRKRESGVYEIRFHRLGYNKSFSSKDFEIARQRAEAFFEKINYAIKMDSLDSSAKKPKFTFDEMLKLYIDKVLKIRSSEDRQKKVQRQYEIHLKQYLDKKNIKSLNAFYLQDILTELNTKYRRVSEDCKIIINAVLEFAVNHGFLKLNPMKNVIFIRQPRINGECISYEQERHTRANIKGTKFEGDILLMLYGGVRNCERKYTTFDLKNNTMTVKNAKKKKWEQQTWRTVPIFPKLLSVIDIIINRPPEITEDNLSKFVTDNKILDGHPLKDLRHTFTSRAKECNIPNELVAIWTGHSLGKEMTASVYTHYSMEYMQKMAKFLNYSIDKDIDSDE